MIKAGPLRRQNSRTKNQIRTLAKTLTVRKSIKVILLISSLLPLTFANAQVIVEHLYVKGGSPGFPYAFGSGTFLEIAARAGDHDKIIFEPGMDYFANRSQWVLIFPILAAYRHYLSSKDYGLYLQPVAGYTGGTTAITKKDGSGSPVTDTHGDTLQQKGNGITAGLGLGYTFKGIMNDYSIELRYEHIFVPADPQITMISLRYV